MAALFQFIITCFYKMLQIIRKTNKLIFSIIRSFCQKQNDDSSLPYQNQLSISDSFSVDMSFQTQPKENSFFKKLYSNLLTMFQKRKRKTKLSFTDLETSFEENQILNDSFNFQKSSEETQSSNSIANNNSQMLKKIYFRNTQRNLTPQTKLNTSSIIKKLQKRQIDSQIKLQNQMQLANLNIKKVPQYFIKKAADGTLYASQMAADQKGPNQLIQINFHTKQTLPKTEQSLDSYQKINNQYHLEQSQQNMDIQYASREKLFYNEQCQKYSEKIEIIIDILKRKKIYAQQSQRVKSFEPTKLTTILENIEY